MLDDFFKKRDPIKNVSFYQIDGAGVYFIGSEKKICYQNGQSKEIIQLDSRCQFLLLGNKLYISDINNEIQNYCIDANTGRVLHNFSDDGIGLLGFYNGRQTKKISLHHKDGNFSIYDTEKEKILFTINKSFRGQHILGEKYSFFKMLSNEMYCYLGIEEIWRVNLSAHGSIKKLLGIVNGRLWVTCYLKESLTKTYHTLLALDVKTGEIIFSRNDMPYFHSSACVLNESNNTIISILRRFDQTFFLELDALSGNIIREQQLTELEEKGFVFGGANNLTLYKDKLYMVVTAVKTIFGKTLAILDLSDLSIPWISKVTEGKATISRDPEVTDTHLYVLDTENTLHVFEKENM